MEDFLKKTIREAGAIGKEYFQRGVSYETKAGPRDLLTEADLASNRFLVDAIHKAYPDHHIMTEENETDINEGAKYEWVIDPIDGTSNFAKGMPFWAPMIALQEDGETIMSAVYFPVMDELFFAKKNEGAFMNDKQIHVSYVSEFSAARGHLFRATPMGNYGDYFERYRRVNARIILETDLSMRHFGCSACLTYVATGALDFAIGNAGMDWDYLPPMLICKEAGAVVTDSNGEPWERGRQDYIIANPDIYDKVKGLFDYE